MRLTALPLLVVSSLLLATAVNAATRPRYGGTMHVALRAAPMSLDPASSNQADWVASRNLSPLIFDTLITLDDAGNPQPALASSWQSDPGKQRWQFSLRNGVTFHDGTPLTSTAVAASLRVSNPNWKVSSAGEAIVIECESPDANLLAELALPRNSIAKRDGANINGTGAFAVSQWEPGKKLTLKANDSYWGGRAFLDSIEIELGANFREQVISFGLGKTQLIEIAPEQARRFSAEGRHVESSAPVELMALVFSHDPQSPEEGHLRGALSLSIDRNSLSNIVLQGGGEPAGGLLPNWMTGYSFIFPVSADMTHAQQERAEAPRASLWTLAFDAADPIERVVAERIALSAGEAGLRLQTTSSATADMRLVRVSLSSLDARVALTQIVAALGLAQPKFNGNAVEDLYAAENALLRSHRIIPLLHLRTAWGVHETVKGWSEGRDGSWRLRDVWLGPEKP